jgi:hypothetical protein
MMALDLQRRAAEKVLQFNREYNDYMEDYIDAFMEQNDRKPTGMELDSAMRRWESRWKDEGQDLFLTDEDKERLRSFEDRGRAAGVTGNFETFNDRWTRIQRERADRAEAKTDQALDEAMMTPEQMIRAIENDQDLSPEDRARLIARIRAGQ